MPFLKFMLHNFHWIWEKTKTRFISSYGQNTIFILQPHNVHKCTVNTNVFLQGSSSALPVKLDSEGRVKYDALVRQGHSKDRVSPPTLLRCRFDFCQGS